MSLDSKVAIVTGVGPEGRYLTGVSIPIAGGMAPGL